MKYPQLKFEFMSTVSVFVLYAGEVRTRTLERSQHVNNQSQHTTQDYGVLNAWNFKFAGVEDLHMNLL